MRKNNENKMEERIEDKYLDKVKGSFFGGAAGDALGYAVEFDREDSIFWKYGEGGIQEYKLDPRSGKALISDDTQMSLFTANAMLVGETRRNLRGIGGPPSSYMSYFYKEWYKTQHESFEAYQRKAERNYAWLMQVPEMFASRAPGITCLNAISSGMGSIEKPLNNSKGCGGIMRVAPLGMRYRLEDMSVLDRDAAETAAITHGHSLGYMPAAMLVHIVSLLIHDEGETLLDCIIDAKLEIARIFEGDEHLDELMEIVERAIRLARNDQDDLTNIHALGEGWVAEETLAIALYCSLRYEDDFSKGIIAAVNHNGDSDSTGAVTGNILGAIHGYEAMEEKWKQDLELADVILEMAEDVCYGCRMHEYGEYYDEEWVRKYIEGGRDTSVRNE